MLRVGLNDFTRWCLFSSCHTVPVPHLPPMTGHSRKPPNHQWAATGLQYGWKRRARRSPNTVIWALGFFLAKRYVFSLIMFSTLLARLHLQLVQTGQAVTAIIMTPDTSSTATSPPPTGWGGSGSRQIVPGSGEWTLDASESWCVYYYYFICSINYNNNLTT